MPATLWRKNCKTFGRWRNDGKTFGTENGVFDLQSARRLYAHCKTFTFFCSAFVFFFYHNFYLPCSLKLARRTSTLVFRRSCCQTMDFSSVTYLMVLSFCLHRRSTLATVHVIRTRSVHFFRSISFARILLSSSLWQWPVWSISHENSAKLLSFVTKNKYGEKCIIYSKCIGWEGERERASEQKLNGCVCVCIFDEVKRQRSDGDEEGKKTHTTEESTSF